MPGAPSPAAGRARPVGHGRGIDPGAEREPHEDHELVDGVEPLDVGGRVGLRVAARLGLGEDVAVVAPLAGHRRQDEVRGPVDDPADARDPVRGQVQRQGAEHGDAARHRRLEAQRAVGGAGRPLQLGAVVGEEMLVRGDHGAPVGEGGRDQRPRRLVAAHDLDDHVDVGARDEVRRDRRSAASSGMPAALALATSRTATPARTSGEPSDGARRGDRSSSARTTSRPTVPAPSTPTRRGWRLTGRSW